MVKEMTENKYAILMICDVQCLSKSAGSIITKSDWHKKYHCKYHTPNCRYFTTINRPAQLIFPGVTNRHHYSFS